MKRLKIFSIILFLVIVMYCPGCSNAYNENEKGPRSEGYAFQSSSYLVGLSDLKVINVAADFLKGLGLNAAFQETLIYYHDAEDIPVQIELESGESLEYAGEYLEVRFYFSDDPDGNPCEECTVIYIDDKGSVLGYKKTSDKETTD